MKSKDLLAAFGGLHVTQLVTMTKERDELLQFRGAIQTSLQGLARVIQGEPEARANEDIVEICKAILLRQRGEIQRQNFEIERLRKTAAEPTGNGALADAMARS